MNNRDQLIDAMSDYALERRELAEMLCVDRATVDNWLSPHGSTRNVEVPDMAVELLKYKLSERASNADETTNSTQDE